MAQGGSVSETSDGTASWVTGAPATLDDLLGIRPDLAELWHRLEDELWQDGTVDPVVLELCRLRVAQLHGAGASLARRTEAAVAAGLTEELVAALSSWPTDDRFAGPARAALTVTELFVVDPHAVTDDHVAELLDAVGASALTTVATALAVWDGISRFERVLGADVG
jgi:alkylhydroperoxidase family enzyme